MKTVAAILITAAFLVSFFVSSPARAQHRNSIEAAIKSPDNFFFCYGDRCVIVVCTDTDNPMSTGMASMVKEPRGTTTIYFLRCSKV